MEENMFTNPVLDGCADPDVIYYEGTYYLYATNTDMKDDSEMGFKVYTSKDLVHWHDAGMALKACDSWGEKQFLGAGYHLYKRPLLSFLLRGGAFVYRHKPFPPRPLCTGGEKASARGYQGN